MRLALVLIPALLIAGCASPESRLRTGLADAGLSKRQSGCMAGRMVDKLSLGQLIKLSSLSKVNREDVRDTGITPLPPQCPRPARPGNRRGDDKGRFGLRDNGLVLP
jgi:hypothetical protein